MATAGLRGRSRTWRWRDRGELAAVLQHVGADPRGARQLLQHPRTDPARNYGRHWLDGVVPRCLTRAIEGAQAALSGVIGKARYWEKLRDVPLNERQRLVINRLLEGFEETDHIQVGDADEELKRYGAAGYPAPRGAGGSCQGPSRWSEYQLFARGPVGSTFSRLSKAKSRAADAESLNLTRLRLGPLSMHEGSAPLGQCLIARAPRGRKRLERFRKHDSFVRILTVQDV